MKYTGIKNVNLSEANCIKLTGKRVYNLSVPRIETTKEPKVKKNWS